jgi:hypothetical protein
MAAEHLGEARRMKQSLCGTAAVVDKAGADRKKNPRRLCRGLIPPAEPSAMKKGGVVICRGIEISGLPLLYLSCERGTAAAC